MVRFLELHKAYFEIQLTACTDHLLLYNLSLIKLGLTCAKQNAAVFIYLFTYLFIYLFTYLFIYLFTNLFIYLFLFILLFIYTLFNVDKLHLLL